MPASRQSKRPGPESYDHLWSLLPVFAAFFAVILFAAAADDRPARDVHATEYIALPAFDEPAAQGDASVPPAAEAMARLPAIASEPAPTF